jgi:hypothetical protein
MLLEDDKYCSISKKQSLCLWKSMKKSSRGFRIGVSQGEGLSILLLLSFEFLFWMSFFYMYLFENLVDDVYSKTQYGLYISFNTANLSKISQQCKSGSIRTTLQHTTNILPLPLPQRKSTPISQQRHKSTHNTPTPLKPLSLHHERSSKLRSRWHHRCQLHHRSHQYL